MRHKAVARMASHLAPFFSYNENIVSKGKEFDEQQTFNLCLMLCLVNLLRKVRTNGHRFGIYAVTVLNFQDGRQNGIAKGVGV